MSLSARRPATARPASRPPRPPPGGGPTPSPPAAAAAATVAASWSAAAQASPAQSARRPSSAMPSSSSGGPAAAAAQSPFASIALSRGASALQRRQSYFASTTAAPDSDSDEQEEDERRRGSGAASRSGLWSARSSGSGRAVTDSSSVSARSLADAGAIDELIGELRRGERYHEFMPPPSPFAVHLTPTAPPPANAASQSAAAAAVIGASATPPRSATLRKLYRIVDGKAVLRPPTSRPDTARSHTSSSSHPPPPHPVVPPLFRGDSERSAAAAADSDGDVEYLMRPHPSPSINSSRPISAAPSVRSAAAVPHPPRHPGAPSATAAPDYSRPKVAHNFTDGSLKSTEAAPTAVASTASSVQSPRASAAAQQQQQSSIPSTTSTSPRRSWSPRRPASQRSGRSTTPSGFASSRSRSPSRAAPTAAGEDPPSRARDALWSRWNADAQVARAQAAAEASSTRALDEALHLTTPSAAAMMLHDNSNTNGEKHALQGMRLVSEDGFAALVAQAAAAEAQDDSSDDGGGGGGDGADGVLRRRSNLPEGAAQAMRQAAAIDPLSEHDLEDDLEDDDDDEEEDEEDEEEDDGEGSHASPRRSQRFRGLGRRPLRNRAAQRDIEEAEAAAHAAQQEQAASAELASIDFHRVGVEVARRLAVQGHPLSSHHLDVLHSLPLLERVWLACRAASENRRRQGWWGSSRSGGWSRGLSEAEFVTFLSEASTMNRPTLAVLFEKMDIHSVKRLSWDAWLSYLVREMAHKFRMAAGAGTFVLRQEPPRGVAGGTGSGSGSSGIGGGGGGGSGGTGGGGSGEGFPLGMLRSETLTSISQMLLLPAHGNPLFPSTTPKIVARCRNDTLQVFDTNTLQYLYHVPLHAPLKKRPGGGGIIGASATGGGRGDAAQQQDEQAEQQSARNRGAGAGGAASADDVPNGSRASAPSAAEEKKMLIYSSSTHARAEATVQEADAALLARIGAPVRPSSCRGEVQAMHADAAARRVHMLAQLEADRARHAAQALLRQEELLEREQASLPSSSAASSRPGSAIRRIPKSATPRPMSSSRPLSATTNNSMSDATMSRPDSARNSSFVPRPPSSAHTSSNFAAAVEAAGLRSTASKKDKERVRSNYEKKLAAYMAGVEAAANAPVAQPLACVGQQEDSGRPPPVARAARDGLIHRQVLELAQRNKPYSFPLTCVSYAAQERQIVLAAADRSVRSFGLVRRQFELQDCFYVHETPQCVLQDTLTASSYTSMHGQRDRGLVVVGTLGGSVLGYAPTSHARVCSLPNLHGEHALRRMEFYPHVGLITAGMDGRLAVVDPATFQLVRYLGAGVGSPFAPATGNGVGGGHTAGVVSFCCAPVSRTLLSAGFDRSVLAWEPRLALPTWRLAGLAGSDILDVLVNEARNQVVLVLRDAKIRVYDSRNYRLLEDVVDTADYNPSGRLTACAFDDVRQRLLTAANRISVFKVEPSSANRAMLSSGVHSAQVAATRDGNDSAIPKAVTTNSADGAPSAAALAQAAPSAQSLGSKAHISSVVAVLYSRLFRQLITVCDNESVRVWDLFAGSRAPVFDFTTAHRAPLTAASLDWSGKRLITSCHRGRVLIHNPNNGELLFEFAQFGAGKIEINRLGLLSSVSQALVATGWSNNVLRWPAPYTSLSTNSLSSKGPRSSVGSSAAAAIVAASSSATPGAATQSVGHRSQILSLACLGNFIITGDARGEVISWAADSGHKLHAFMLPATSQELSVTRDTNNNNSNANKTTEAKGAGRRGGTTTNTAATIKREACSPAVTALHLFVLHDLSSFDAWQAEQAAEQDEQQQAATLSSPSATGSKARANLSSAPSRRRGGPYAHAARTGLLVGTDDGSVHLLAAQGLVLLQSRVHTLEGTVVSMGVLQRVRLEEVNAPPPQAQLPVETKGAASRRATMLPPSSANVAEEKSAVPSQNPPVSSMAAKLKALTIEGGGLASARGNGNPNSSSAATGAGSELAVSTPRVTQNFHKRVVFAAVPKLDASAAAAPTTTASAASAEDDTEGDLGSLVAELGEGVGEREDRAAVARRRPFSTRNLASFRPLVDRVDAQWYMRGREEEPEPRTIEEFLEMKQKKQAAAAAAAAGKAAVTAAGAAVIQAAAMTTAVAEEAKTQHVLAPRRPALRIDDGGDSSNNNTFLTEVQTAPTAAAVPVIGATGAVAVVSALSPRSAAAQVKLTSLSSVVDEAVRHKHLFVQQGGKLYRRVLETRMLLADSMSESDALLFDVHTERQNGDESDHSEAGEPARSPLLTALSWNLQLRKAFFLHAPMSSPSSFNPAAPVAGQPLGPDGTPLPSLGLRPPTSDATSELSVVCDPLVGVHLFVAASSEGRVTLWSPEGDHVAALGQAERWPLAKPAGSVLEQVHEGSSTPRWPRAGAVFGFDGADGGATNRSDLAAGTKTASVDDNWSSDDDSDDDEDGEADDESDVENMDFTPEQQHQLITMALGFDPNDLRHTDAVTALRRGAKVAADTAKQDGIQLVARRGSVAVTARSSPLSRSARTSATASTVALSSNANIHTTKEQRKREKQRRLLDELKARYASSFVQMQSRGDGSSRPGSAMGPSASAASAAANANEGLPISAEAAKVVGSSSLGKSFAESHPFHVPETLRVGGLRSALFLNDAKLRLGRTHEQIRVAIAAREAARRRRLMHVAQTDGEAAAKALEEEERLNEGVHALASDDMALFQLGPRDEAAARVEQSRREHAMHRLTMFLSERSNVLDERTGQVRDHATARLAVLFEQKEAAARRREMQQRALKDTRPTHVRVASRVAKQAATNVFLRLAPPPLYVGASPTATAAPQSGSASARRASLSATAKSAGTASSTARGSAVFGGPPRRPSTARAATPNATARPRQ